MPRGENLRGGRLPNSGRRKGVIAKKKLEFVTAIQRCEQMGFDPIESMILLAKGEAPCTVCRGTGKSKFQPGTVEAGHFSERTCQSCYGSGKEKITPQLRGAMAEAVARKTHPDLKAIDHSGNIGLVVSVAESLRLKRAERLGIAPKKE